MNYGMNDTICFKRYFYLLICNELFCIKQGNQLLIITNTMNIITILQQTNFNVFLHCYFLHFNARNVIHTCMCLLDTFYSVNINK